MNEMKCPHCNAKTKPYCARALGGSAYECGECFSEWETDEDGDVVKFEPPEDEEDEETKDG